MSLISGRRRTHSVIAGEGCVLIESPRRTTLKLINSVAAVRRVVDEAFLLRAIETQLAKGLSPTDLRILAGSATVHAHDANQVLFKEGDPGDALYLIRSGSVMVSRMIGGREVVLAYVPAGQYVGEMALISDLPRTATVNSRPGMNCSIMTRSPCVQADSPRITGGRFSPSRTIKTPTDDPS